MSGDVIGVVGLGLLGGSLVRGLRRERLASRIVGVEGRDDVRHEVAAAALCDALLDAPGSALAACDLVVLCAPIGAVEAMLAGGALAQHLKKGAIVTDVAGTKAPIVAAARALPREIAFVGGHPMFGGEAGGFAASRDDLWRGGVVAVCTDGAPQTALDRVVALHRALGADVVTCTADEHDAAVAAVSHLPYVVAGALALAARDAGPLALRLAGKGFDDLTRVAGFRYEVQGEVSRKNAHLPSARARFEARLAAIAEALAKGPDGAATLLDEARAIRESRRRP